MCDIAWYDNWHAVKWYSNWRRGNCLYHILVKSGMLETNKQQVLIFKFGEDLSYFVILRYKLRDLIKVYDDYVSGPI